MKKTITIISFILLTINIIAQEKFTYSEKGLTDYVVIEIDSLNQNELYNKTIDWIKESYVNPDEVIKAKFENEKLRFNGFKENAFKYKVFGMSNVMDGRYSIEISFKDGKLKFDPISLEEHSFSKKYSADGWAPISLETNTWLYKSNGTLIKAVDSYPEDIIGIFNNLILSLNDYLLKESGAKKDSKKDW